MHRLVYNVFKTIMISMILVFAFDMASYLYRTASVNRKMESLMVSMQREVMENNGLTEDTYKMYKQLLIDMAHDMNTDSTQPFINGYWINYNATASSQHPCLTSITSLRGGTSTNILVQDLSKTGSYGDVMVVQVGVSINQPIWDFVNASHNAPSFQNDRTSASLNPAVQELWYTYYVPCMKYTVD